VIRIVLVDDQELLRTGFRMILDAQQDMTVVGEAADGLAALELLDRCPADVVLMDVRMPKLDGVEATRRLLSGGGEAKGVARVLILTTFDLDEYAFAAIKAGASGFLLKDVPPAELLTAIRAVHWATRSWPRPRPAGCSTASPRCCRPPTPRRRRAWPG
jgi:DNA-binding NarL/FixJ family response regulator